MQTNGMATDFTQDSLLHFLQNHGGKVKNSELLSHYRTFLRDNENQKQNREMFKRFVNTVAVVKQDEGVSYIVLKKAYLRLSVDVKAPKTGRKTEQTARVRQPSSRADVNQNQDDAFPALTVHTKSQRELDVPPSCITQINTDQCLPVAGILNNNNVDAVHFDKPIQNSAPSASHRALPRFSTEELSLYETKPQVTKQDEKHFKAEPVQRASKSPELCSKPKYAEVTLGQPKEPTAPREPDCPPPKIHPHAVELEEVPFQQVGQPPVSRQVHSNGAKDRGMSNAVAAPWPLHPMLQHASRISKSSPCISDSPAAKYQRALPDSELTRSNGNLTSARPQESGAPSLLISQPPHSSLSLEEGFHSPPASGYVDLHHIHPEALPGLSSSRGSLVPSSADSPDWPQGSSAGEWTSDEELDCRSPSGEREFKVLSMLQRAEQAKRLSLAHRSERNSIAWHCSTGDLDSQNLSTMSPWNHSTSHLDNQEPPLSWHRSMGNLHDDQVEPDAGPSGIMPVPVLRPSVRRLKSKLRNRMSRSLGAGLDQEVMEDSIAARHNRLQLLSTSLSFRYPFSTGSTPPRANSRRDLASSPAPSSKSVSSTGHLHDNSYFHRQPLVPLESNEHNWLVRGAAGSWTEIYSLFREDPGLLTKRDFITGYTVLHWVAKHGDHKVLNTLWYGVNKMGMTLDIDSKTTCGYTPLHLAAIHGHKMMIRLLIHTFKANVSLRDTSGKKAWQYLGGNVQGDLLKLLGAPPRAGGTTGAKIATSTPPGSSPDRQGTASGAVKRSTSIAAFLKPKNLLRNANLHTDSLI